MRRITRTIVVVSAGVVGAVVTAWLAGFTYLQVWAPSDCNDVIHPGETLSCAAPAAPGWSLVGGALLGGLSLAVAAWWVVRSPSRPVCVPGTERHTS